MTGSRAQKRRISTRLALIRGALVALCTTLVVVAGGKVVGDSRPLLPDKPVRGPIGEPAPAFQIGVAAGGILHLMPAERRDAYLDGVRALGARWLRVDFSWRDIQPRPTTYDWQRFDALVAAAAERDLRIVGTLAYAPVWARTASCADDQMCRPKDLTAYAAFAAVAATRFAPRGVHHWEIWNEPNIATFFKPAPDPDYYARMLMTAYAAIHRSDPLAVVISGGLSPSSTAQGNYSPVDFTARTYAAGAQGFFDVMGHHPYCYEGGSRCPRTPMGWSAWTQMNGTRANLRALMARHGDDTKPIWATEFGAPTGGGRGTVTEAQQRRMLLEAITGFAAYPWAGPLFLYSYQDRGTDPRDREDWFGLVRADGSHKPAYPAVAQLLASGVSPEPSSAPASPTTAPSAAPTASMTPVGRALARLRQDRGTFSGVRAGRRSSATRGGRSTRTYDAT